MQQPLQHTVVQRDLFATTWLEFLLYNFCCSLQRTEIKPNFFLCFYFIEMTRYIFRYFPFYIFHIHRSHIIELKRSNLWDQKAISIKETFWLASVFWDRTKCKQLEFALSTYWIFLDSAKASCFVVMLPRLSTVCILFDAVSYFWRRKNCLGITITHLSASQGLFLVPLSI